MPKIVHISGAVDAFYHALADRLHRAGATLTEDPSEAEVTVGIGAVSYTHLTLPTTPYV